MNSFGPALKPGSAAGGEFDGEPRLVSASGVTMAAGGPLRKAELRYALARAPVLVAADGGADRLLDLGHDPGAVIGDLDSLSPAARQRLATRLIRLDEQETTDFDKALRVIQAPFVLALGCLGGRADHGLAVLSGLMRHQAGGGSPCVLLGPEDVVFAAPPALDLGLRRGDRISLWPMADMRGESEGLEWPAGGVRFSPLNRVGTSNRVIAPEVRLRFDQPGMLIILPRARLDAALRALS